MQDTPVRRVVRVRHEIQRRELQVLKVEAPSPHTRRITLTGDALADFVSASFDDHVKLILEPGPGGETVRRDYTPRRYDNAARELVLEFALHGDGPAAAWAASARPGSRAVVAGPKGSLVIPLDYDWHLLAGDETALPAIARRLEELPASTRAIVVVQTEAAERRPLPSAAAVELHWVADAAELLATGRRLALPTGEGYAWCAGEAAAMAQLRRILVEEKGHDRHAIRASAYWKRGAVAHHEDLED